MAYALLVRDLGSGDLRGRLDAILEGSVPLPTDPVPPSLPSSVPGLPPRPMSPQEVEALRDTWGMTPDAIRRKQALDAFTKTQPPMR